MIFIAQKSSRDVRPPTGAGGRGGAAAGEKSLAAPSHSGIIAHSFARTHDTFTNTKPKSISRLAVSFKRTHKRTHRRIHKGFTKRTHKRIHKDCLCSRLKLFLSLVAVVVVVVIISIVLVLVAAVAVGIVCLSFLVISYLHINTHRNS